MATNDLQALITATLGVEPTAPVVQYKTKQVPSRPEPLYEFDVSFSKYESGSATVQATGNDDAWSQANDIGYDEICWSEDPEVDTNDISKLSDTPTNQDELDEWDEQYGGKYDHDGDPICSECEDSCPLEMLTDDPDDASRWLCKDCLHND